MRYYYDPLDKACKSLTGAIPCGSELTLNIDRLNSGEGDFSAEACRLILWQDGGEQSAFPMRRDENGFTITLKFNCIGLYFYIFDFGSCGFGCGSLRKGTLSHDPKPWQITVYDEEYATPEWMKGGVMYQIFPDRFHKSGDIPIENGKILRFDWGGQPNFRPNENGKVLNNDFFGGNLNGIREKLDYLASLHVSVIYFNPIFEAFSNHRYDTGDYFKIDPLLGTEEDFDRLVQEAEKRGIRIILDGVFNHTGDNSRYFNKYGKYKEELGAHQSPDSPYFNWYRFTEFPDSYESWWGIDTLPAVNENSLSYQNFIFGEDGVLKHWLRHGIGGFRLDVADELPDFFLQKLRTAVKEENSDAVIIGEVWEDASNKIAYDVRRQYLQGYELDSVMNYPLKNAIIHFVLTGSTVELRESICMLLDNYPKATLDALMNILGTHDTPRILTVCGDKQCADKEEMSRTSLSDEEKVRAKERVRMAAVLQYTLPGVPCVFYGDEIGMEGYMDPFCRGCFPWKDMDESLGEFYRKLGEIRTRFFPEVFKDGTYREVFADNSCIVYERKKGDQAVYIYANKSGNQYETQLKGAFVELLSGRKFEGRCVIWANSYGILAKKQ